jgi:hypothetical protein
MSEKVLVLRTCAADLTSHDGFKWPSSGPVKCLAWSPEPKCGNGLHGLLRGEGNGNLLNWNEDAKWLVVEVDADAVVKIDDGKVKFPEGVVVFCGDRRDATEMVRARHPDAAVVGGTATAGHRGTATAGDLGTATAGNWGTATAGNWGTATAGNSGTATAGHRGTATAGDSGTATAGYMGTATAGYMGTATAGVGGSIILKHWLRSAERYIAVVGNVGIDGIEANVPYCCDETGKLVRKE